MLNFEKMNQTFNLRMGKVFTVNGDDGASAYEIAVENGFRGTEEEWLQSLHGQDGRDGQPGAPGSDASVTAANIASALGYTPADAEKVNQLSEEKADKSEIPAPYILPTASATVKGGVMVGDDFVMDGEKLRKKPENEYELIETIAVGYRLLSEKPDDWETNWSAYYKVGDLSTGIAALSSKTSWEPYKYYADDEYDGVRTVRRTQAPDGTPYRFTRVTLKMRVEKASMSGALNCCARETEDSINQVATINSLLDTSGVRWASANFEVENGYAKVLATGCVSYFYSMTSITSASVSRFIQALKEIGTLEFITAIDAPVPKGSVFEIWGVRA